MCDHENTTMIGPVQFGEDLETCDACHRVREVWLHPDGRLLPQRPDMPWDEWREKVYFDHIFLTDNVHSCDVRIGGHLVAVLVRQSDGPYVVSGVFTALAEPELSAIKHALDLR